MIRFLALLVLAAGLAGPPALAQPLRLSEEAGAQLVIASSRLR